MKWTPNRRGRAFRNARPHVSPSKPLNLNLVLELYTKKFSTLIITANSISFVITLIKLRIISVSVLFIVHSFSHYRIPTQVSYITICLQWLYNNILINIVIIRNRRNTVAFKIILKLKIVVLVKINILITYVFIEYLCKILYCHVYG
jgi:hypothetical protein